MYRYVVITDPETAPGFRLAGVEVGEADDGAQACTLLRHCLGDPEVGLVALNERFLTALDEPLRRHVDVSALPAVVVFPDLRGGSGAAGEDYLAALIQRAIGYRVRLRP